MQDLDLKYLKEVLRLNLTAGAWSGTDSLPLYLKSESQFLEMTASGIPFLLIRVAKEATLPDLKRLHAQLSKRVDIPVVISSLAINDRQRKALASQGIPFICAGRQASLPFLGAASTEWGKAKLETGRRRKLTPKAQQTAIWGALEGENYTLSELEKATAMSASQASSAVSELVDRGMASRSKNGRVVSVMPIGKDELLENHMEHLASPILRTMYVQTTPSIEMLPDAGESALAKFGELNPPSVQQKATSRAGAKNLKALEVLQGELPDRETTQVQVWKYDPLFAESDQVDPISLALSLANTQDERIESEIDSLFGKEFAWQKAL